MLKLSIFLAVLTTSVPIFSQHISHFTNPTEEICPSSCLQPKSTHRECGMNLKRWFYNRESKKCESFQYGGCGGNGNRFLSKSACLNRCGDCPSMDIPVDPSDDPTCSCQYFPLSPYKGGCRITVAPPKGYKCQCGFRWFDWICEGYASKCANYEICPANCKTKECCERGITEFDGDCGGYYNVSSGVRTNQIFKNGRIYPTKLEEFKLCIVETDSTLLSLVVDQESNSSYYDRLNYQWNLRQPKRFPLAFVVPTTTEHVANAVKCGVRTQIPLTPKSGGHSFEAYSYGTNHSIIIDFRDMDQLVIDEEEGTARIGPGALLGPVDVKLFKGNWAIPMGNCFTVALGGHAIGGGFGILSHIYGLALDKVLEQRMVDGNGEIRTANRTHNPDLYWGLRGMGPGYIGLVTDFKVNLTKTQIGASQLLMSVGLNIYPLTAAEELLTIWDKWLDWTTQNDRTTISSMYITGRDFKNTLPGKLSPLAAGFSVSAQHTEMAAFPDILPIAFFDAFKQYWPNDTYPDKKMLKVFGYKHVVLETQHTPLVRDDYNRSLTLDEILNLKDYKDLPRYFKIKSFYITKRLSPMDITRIAEVIQRIPCQSVWIMIESEGGVLHDVAKDATAYVHRNSRYSMAAQYEGSDDPIEVAAGMKWIDEFMAAWESLDNGETYQNFPDNALLKDEEYLKRYYGSNLERLETVKAKYDPKNYFVGPNSLPVDVVPKNYEDSSSNQSDSDEK